MTISLCMIVKNEEAHLAQCLQSVQGAVEQVVVLDTGSTDATKEIARRFTPHVYDYMWENDFSAARNASFAWASEPFILWLDADDVLEPEEREKLIALKARLDEHVDAVMMPYQYAFDENGAPTLVFERERIVRRAAGFRFEGVVHEAMAVSGVIWHENIAVRHTGTHGASSNRRNLAIYTGWLERGRAFSARDRYYYARELMNAGETDRAEQAFAQFLAMDGWLENRIDAHVQRGDCLMRLGRMQEAQTEYMAALGCGEPRAEALCAMGGCLLAQGDVRAAAFWYRAALCAEKPTQSTGFVQMQAYGYLPKIQLCVCYDRMGRMQEAERMNELALEEKPNDVAALTNRAYFAGRRAQEKGAIFN